MTGMSGGRPRVRRLVRLALAVLAALATLWLVGFGWFLWLASDTPAVPGHVDAIVVLTGGPDRVEIALHLLAAGAGDRLLISGAGEKTELAALAHLAEIDPAPLEQRVTLGHEAQTTHGNALETAAWATQQHVGTLLVVTSWFHMPRAMVEMRRAMPGVTAHPWPVGRPNLGELNWNGAHRLIGEYHKFLATLVGFTASPFHPTHA